MLSPSAAFSLYTLLTSHAIRTWVCGGWGIDALLGRQTRPHHDLDVLMLLDDVFRLRRLLARHRFSLTEFWEENLWAVDSSGRKVPTAFYLDDPAGRELDVHALRLDSQGVGTPCWEKEPGFRFTPADLSGQGTLNDRPVACVSAEFQMAAHTGYIMPAKQFGDIEALHQEFGLPYPPGYQPANLFQSSR